MTGVTSVAEELKEYELNKVYPHTHTSTLGLWFSICKPYDKYRYLILNYF
jgi:hypothetical protein